MLPIAHLFNRMYVLLFCCHFLAGQQLILRELMVWCQFFSWKSSSIVFCLFDKQPFSHFYLRDKSPAVFPLERCPQYFGFCGLKQQFICLPFQIPCPHSMRLLSPVRPRSHFICSWVALFSIALPTYLRYLDRSLLNLPLCLPVSACLVSIFSTRNGVPCCHLPTLSSLLSLAPPPSGPCAPPLPFLCSPPPGKCGESVSVIAAQLDPNEEGKNRFFSRNKCYYACVCVAVHAGWSRDFGPLHPSPLLERKGFLSLCVCNVGSSCSRDFYRRLAAGQAGCRHVSPWPLVFVSLSTGPLSRTWLSWSNAHLITQQTESRMWL